MSHWQLETCEDGKTILDRLVVADRFWSRLRGLLFRSSLPAGEGLMLVPCASIHTHWMRFAVDVAMLNKTGKVLDVRLGVRPWRIVRAPINTHAVLEAAAGTLTLTIGDMVGLRCETGAPHVSESLAEFRCRRGVI